jgi:putative transposase
VDRGTHVKVPPRRGLRGVKLVVSAAHEGINFMRNALAHAGKGGRRVVSAFIATAFAQDDAGAAKLQWRKLARLMNQAEPDLLAFMNFPDSNRAKLRFTNPIERLKRRDQAPLRSHRHLPNEAAIRRLVGAILLDEWAVQRARYMTLETIAPISDEPIVGSPAFAT